MVAWLYVETNAIVGFASGRDSALDELFTPAWLDRPSLRIAIPSLCFMEAFSTLSASRKSHLRRVDDYKRFIAESRRAAGRPGHPERQARLEGGLQEINEMFEQFERRLEQGVRMLSTHATLIEATQTAIGRAFDRRLIPDMTDNLILTCLLDHAARHPGSPLAFHSGNSHDFHKRLEARAALNSAGIKYFHDPRGCLDWLARIAPASPTDPTDVPPPS